MQFSILIPQCHHCHCQTTTITSAIGAVLRSVLNFRSWISWQCLQETWYNILGRLWWWALWHWWFWRSPYHGVAQLVDHLPQPFMLQALERFLMLLTMIIRFDFTIITIKIWQFYAWWMERMRMVFDQPFQLSFSILGLSSARSW